MLRAAQRPVAPANRWSALAAPWIVVLGAICALGLIVAVGALRPSLALLVAGGVVGLGGLLVLLRNPALGPIAVVAVCLIVPFGVGTGTQTQLNAGTVLLGLVLGVWILQAVSTPRAPTYTSPAIPPLVLFVLVSLVAFVAGNQSWIPFAETAPVRAQAGGLGIIVLSAGAFLLAAYRLSSLAWIAGMTWIFLALGGVYIVLRLAGAGDWAADVYGIVGSVFWIWLTILAFSQAVYNRHLAWWWRASLMGLVAGTLYVSMVWTGDWLSGWVPPLVAIVVTVAVASPRLVVPLGLLVCGLVATVAPFLFASLSSSDNEYSLMTRLEAWQVLWQIFTISPIIGIGPANYYWYTPLFPILGYAVSFNSHNNYIDIVLQTGLLGLACFSWFSVTLGIICLRLPSRVADGFPKAYIFGATGGLAGTLVAAMLGDWVLPFVYNVGFAGLRSSLVGWLFLGAILAVQRISDGDSPVRSPRDPRMAQSSRNGRPI